ncbi:MAG: hypothetical protein JWO15_3864 [Sphingomonadales bacterium]|nr:hypothetical protein [Sphingomonadales bacterium]
MNEVQNPGGYVYRAFDAADRLLYVGCSVDVDARLNYHQQHSNWWPFHCRIEREGFASRDEALAAEATAIFTEHPRWNMTGRSPNHPDGAANAVNRAPWLDAERQTANALRALQAEKQQLAKAMRKVNFDLRGMEALCSLIAAGEVIDLEDGAA